MTAIVLIGHGQVAEAMLDAAQSLCGPLANVAAVGIAPQDSLAEIERKISGAVDALADGGCTLFLVDVLGASPAQVATRLARKCGAAMVTGLSLPMLLKAIEYQANTAPVIASYVQQAAGRYCVLV